MPASSVGVAWIHSAYKVLRLHQGSKTDPLCICSLRPLPSSSRPLLSWNPIQARLAGVCLYALHSCLATGANHIAGSSRHILAAWPASSVGLLLGLLLYLPIQFSLKFLSSTIHIYLVAQSIQSSQHSFPNFQPSVASTFSSS